MEDKSNRDPMNFYNSLAMNDCKLTVLNVSDLFQAKYSCLTGGRSRRNYTIITFHECSSYPSISDEQFKTLFAYVSSILSPEEFEIGVVMVVDRREDKWSSIKTLLIQISNFVPTKVQKVFVLRPIGFLQKALSDLSLKFLTPEFRLKVLVLDSVEELHDHIDKDQLTSDFEGTLEFNHAEWIQHRAALETFSSSVFHLNQSLKNLCQDLEEGEFPNDVKQTELLMKEHETLRIETKETIDSTVNHGCLLLECILANSISAADADSGISVVNSDDSVASYNSIVYPETFSDAHRSNAALATRNSICGPMVNENSRPIGVKSVARASIGGFNNAFSSISFNHNFGNKNKMSRGSVCVVGVTLVDEVKDIPRYKSIHLQAVERLLDQLEDTSAKFDLFWQHHISKLAQCSQLRKFEEDFKQLQVLTEKHLKRSSEIKFCFDDVNFVQEANDSLNAYETETKDDIRRASLLRFRGQKFIEGNHYALDCIKPKCSELERVVELYDNFLKEKTSIIREATLLHERLEKISNWSEKAETFLEKYFDKRTSLTFDQMQTVNSHITYLDEKLESLEMKKMKNFENDFKDLYTKILSEKVQKALNRFECAMVKLNKYKRTLGKFIQSPTETKKDNLELKSKTPNSGEISSESPVKTIHNFFNILNQRKSSLPSELIKKNAYVNLIPLHLNEGNSHSTNSSTQNTPDLFSLDVQTPFINAKNAVFTEDHLDGIGTKRNCNVNYLNFKKVNQFTESPNNFTNLQKFKKLTSQLSLNEDYVDFNNNNMTTYGYPTSENENETGKKDFNNNLFSNSMFEKHSDNNNLKYSSVNSLSVTNLNLLSRTDSKLKKKFSFMKKKNCEKITPKILRNSKKLMNFDDKKQRDVMKKLFEAEEAYLKTLERVSQTYIAKLDERKQLRNVFDTTSFDMNLAELNDEDVSNTQYTVFSNWKLIYYFHSRTFYRDLERAISRKNLSDLVACFSVHEDTLVALYSEYCSNRAVSHLFVDSILKSPFMQDCVGENDCKESLEILLEKPLQQLHIYNDLLKQLLHTSTASYDNVTERILNRALDFVLIRGFEGDLKKGGPLVMHGHMLVSVEEARRGGLKIRLAHTFSARHVFFYERFLLLSKKKELEDKNLFEFKTLLPMNELVLVENAKIDKKKFKIFMSGSDIVYIFQTNSAYEKDIWISELKNVLATQEKPKNYSFTRKDSNSTSVWIDKIEKVEETIPDELEIESNQNPGIAMVKAN